MTIECVVVEESFSKVVSYGRMAEKGESKEPEEPEKLPPQPSPKEEPEEPEELPPLPPPAHAPKGAAKGTVKGARTIKWLLAQANGKGSEVGSTSEASAGGRMREVLTFEAWEAQVLHLEELEGEQLRQELEARRLQEELEGEQLQQELEARRQPRVRAGGLEEELEGEQL